MTNSASVSQAMKTKRLRRSIFVLTFSCLLALLAQPCQAQTFTVVHTFTGGGDGAAPYAGLTMDSEGNFYGTASAGGRSGNGVVFKLSHTRSNWTLTPLYSFRGGSDGSFPASRVILGPDGALYGTTTFGGQAGCNGHLGCGTVYALQPPPNRCNSVLCEWTKTTLYQFTGGSDGANPEFGDLVFDHTGNIYGTTFSGAIAGQGCYEGCGVVYELTHSQGQWTQHVLYSFRGNPDGGNPYAGPTFDSTGNIYGTTWAGGAGGGTIYALTPTQNGWTENVIHSFTYSDGDPPIGGVTFDAAGNMYGTTYDGPVMGVSGTAYELTSTNGNWTYTTLYEFPNTTLDSPGGPAAALNMDAAGTIYGTTSLDGSCNGGSVFRLTPSGNGWTESDLHSFCGTDGFYSISNVAIGSNQNLYSTTAEGGEYSLGVVWEITP